MLLLAVIAGGFAWLSARSPDQCPSNDGCSYATEIMRDSPRGYWRFGEASGTTAGGATGAAAASYLGGVVLGRRGAASIDANTSVLLDGVDDTVRTSSSARLNPTRALSIESWIRPSKRPAASATIVRKDLQYLLRLTARGAVVVRLWKRGAGVELSTSAGAVRFGAWNHVVASWDGETVRIYVNGGERATGALAAPIDTAGHALYVGSSQGAYDWLEGGIDEVALYGSAISTARVAAHRVAAGVETAKPRVRLDTPASNSTMDARPNFGGNAGSTDAGAASVSVRIHRGPTAGGPVVRTLTTVARSSGTFSVRASSALPTGVYTARAARAAGAGAIGHSTPRTFKVDAGAAPVVLAAGDIAGCDSLGDEATAGLLDRLPGTVTSVGDHVYERATAADFANCYDPTWGRHKARTKPVVGDHEYLQPGAAAYFDYFGAAAGARSRGYYSYDLGTWHVVTMNTNCARIGGCQRGSAEERWLRADLAANRTRCTLLFLHDPRFSSGIEHGGNYAMQDFWKAAYDHRAEVVVSGNDHVYERFAPQTPGGAARATGIRQFVVGTGGRSHYEFGPVRPNSQVRDNDTFGVLKLTLRSRGYDWRFVAARPGTFTDAGSTSCH